MEHGDASAFLRAEPRGAGALDRLPLQLDVATPEVLVLSVPPPATNRFNSALPSQTEATQAHRARPFAHPSHRVYQCRISTQLFLSCRGFAHGRNEHDTPTSWLMAQVPGVGGIQTFG